MEKELNGEVTLAIETAFGRGSLSVLEGSEEIDFLICGNGKSRAEDILSEISYLLERNKIGKKQIKKIVYAGGAGSRTGLRIGAATAKGLKFALGCEIAEVSVLAGLVLKSDGFGFVQTAIGISHKNIYRQIFRKIAKNSFAAESLPQTLAAADFFSEFYKTPHISETVFLGDRTVFGEEIRGQESFSAKNSPKIKFLEFSENIAGLIGVASTFKSDEQ